MMSIKGIKSGRSTLMLVIVLISALVVTSCAQAVSAEQQYHGVDLKNYKDKTVFMHVGSPLILSGEDIAFLDSKNFDVAAAIHKKRTLVPLRAVAEYFGATVSYDEKNREALISFGEQQFVFPIGKAEYSAMKKNGKETVAMDTEALILNGRTMVPIRVIAEQLLKKNVDYKDGVIMISGEAAELSKQAGLVDAVKSKIGTATKAQSKEQLSRLMRNNEARYAGDTAENEKAAASGRGSSFDTTVQVVTEEAVPAENRGAVADSGNTKHSSTNTQVEGIDEADIIKTDGKYLYYAGSNAVRIIKVDGPKLTEVYTIKVPDEKYIQEIYVDNDRLVLLGNRNEYSKNGYSVKGEPDTPMTDTAQGIAQDTRMIYPGYHKTFAFADIYNIENPGKPSLLKSHEMEGYYLSSRKSGSNLYLITNTNCYGGIILPLMRDTVRGEEAVPIALSDIMVMPKPTEPGYIILSAIDITDDSKTEVEAVTAFGATVYMSESALYLAAENYNGTTSITKFEIDGMNIGYAGSGSVKGSLLNQFSMDEFDGNLRVATTIWEDGNNLFILDDSLNVIGSVTDLAKGERIYSVRFMGDKGYIVTFRNMDPLFVFDLSDPQNPKVTGELKIPGFSNYLHPVGEDLILGIGMETRELFERNADGRETPVGFRQGGLKISLFDVSDMGKPKEITNLIIGENGSYSEALYNHKAVMVDPDSQQIAFDAYIVKDKNWTSEQGALVVSYKGRSVTQKGLLKYEEPEVYGKYIPYGRRTVYINDILYYIQDGIINAFDYNSYEKVGSLVLK